MIIFIVWLLITIPMINSHLNLYNIGLIIGISLTTIYLVIFESLIIFVYYRTKKIVSYIDNLRKKENWIELRNSLNDEAERKLNTDGKYWAALALLDYDSTKAMNLISDLIRLDFESNNFNSKFINLLKYYPVEDKDLLYETMFDVILILQKAHFFNFIAINIYTASKTTAATTAGPYINSYATTLLKKLAKIFGYTTFDKFIEFNIITAFQKIFKSLSPNKPIDLRRLAELCRVSDDVVLRYLRKIIEKYPTIGYYQDFEMMFIPSEKINKIEIDLPL